MKVRGIIASAFVFTIIALAIGFSSCNRMAPMVHDTETEMPSMMDAEISIGVAVALTGANAEPYGIPMQRGLELAREEINMLGGGNITFITVDAQSTVEGGVAAVQQLVKAYPPLSGLVSRHISNRLFRLRMRMG